MFDSRGLDFFGTTVGLARVSAMCSRDSGAVNQVKGGPTEICHSLTVAGQSLSWACRGHQPRSPAHTGEATSSEDQFDVCFCTLKVL
jgi:hypothetical protein